MSEAEEAKMSAGDIGALQNEVLNVHVRAPPFWRANPALWFAQLEAQFDVYRISKDKMRYNHAVSALDTQILEQVSDIILDPPDDERYQTLKKRLLEVFADSEQQKLKKLLMDLKLNDKRPSQFLREIKSLAGTSLSTDTIRTLWLQRLPGQVHAILSTTSEDVDHLAIMADKIIEALPYEVNAINKNNPFRSEGEIESLTRAVSELTTRISNFENNSKRFRSRMQSRSRSRPRIRTRSASKEGKKICFYHRKFATQARRCVKPCEFVSEN